MKGVLHVCFAPEFGVGDPPPDGYLAWHEWAEVQCKAGLSQKRCGSCGLWRFPQEFSERTIESRYRYVSDNAEIVEASESLPICLKCTASGRASGSA